MKSELQIQLDNTYEILRVAYTHKKEMLAPVYSLPSRQLLHLPFKDVPSSQVQQSADWEIAWFSHYE